ncbi:MAG: DUF5749 family beta-barrel protein [Candidatus Thermoplasmatota archaeon]
MPKKIDYIARFIIDSEGNRIGESISVYKDLLIIKRNNEFYAIPFRHIEKKDENIIVKGAIEWENAKKLAEEWKNAQNGYSSK